ncbi:hypothetical protein ACWD6K_14300 [Streptomyces sp. NPDC002431]
MDAEPFERARRLLHRRGAPFGPHHGLGHPHGLARRSKEQISEDQARDAVEWVSDSLGIQHDDLLQAAGFIGHPDAPSLTLNQAVDHYGDPIAFTLYMVLLCGGLVATVGDADPEWLKQFDLVS